jgi:NADH-quinone oxidoreductase subunit N
VNSINDQLTGINESLTFLLPEGWLCLGIVLLIIGSMIKRIPPATFYGATLGFLIVNGILLFIHWPQVPFRLMGGLIRVDDFSTFFKMLTTVGALLTLLIDNRRDRLAEYYLLILSVVIGSHFLLMSMSLIMVVLALELISISSYVLATGLESTEVSAQKKSAEAAWKYFLFGSASTAIMVFGMSYLFGLTGTLDFASNDFVNKLIEIKSPLLLIGGLMALTGFLFKVTAVPFHLWAPDVYEATPTPIVAFFSVVPKLAGLGILAKFILALHLFGQSVVDWSLLIGILALASILVGSLAALAQTNAKRMMAYSSIAQSGFLLAALSTISMDGLRIAIFYSSVFLVTNLLIFHILVQAEEQFKSSEMGTYSGWGYISVLPSVGMVMGMISLVGLPPTGGFMAKLFLFSGLWKKFDDSGQYFFLLLFSLGLLAAVISLFFYLRLPYYLFLRKPPIDLSTKKTGLHTNLLTIILVMLLFGLFFLPGLLMGWANKVNFVL